MREIVEILESRRHAGHNPTAGGDRVDLFQGAGHDCRQRQVILGGTTISDVVHRGLRAINNLIDIAITGVTHLNNASTSLDEPTQNRPLLDDQRVVGRIGRSRNRGDKGVEIRRTANPAQFADAGELSGHCDGIDWFTPAVQIQNG